MRIELTEHAVERARQRLGWSESALARMTDRVLHFGPVVAQTTGVLRRYLQRRVCSSTVGGCTPMC